MDYIQAVILGIVEGLTEFLPVSSTGHLTIAEKLLGLQVDDPAVTAFTAVIQMGAIFAVIFYFWRDIWRIATAWSVGLVKPEVRGQLDHRMGWYVIAGSIPIGIVGFAAKGLITGPLRSLWVVAFGLILWSVVMVIAERRGRQDRRRAGPDPARRGHRRPDAVHRAGPGGLALRAPRSRRACCAARPGQRDPAVVLPVHPGAAGRRPLRAARTPWAGASGSARPSSAPWSASSSPTPRWPGC